MLVLNDRIGKGIGCKDKCFFGNAKKMKKKIIFYDIIRQKTTETDIEIRVYCYEISISGTYISWGDNPEW